MENNYNFEDVLIQFDFKAVVTDLKPFGLGHINDTFVVNCEDRNGVLIRYILQRINTNIFKTPENLMENIKNVTTYLNEKIVARGGDPDRETLNLIKTSDGSVFYKNLSGDYWRCYKFIEGAQTYQVVENLKHF